MFKLDLDPLAPKLLQNKEAHIDYLKYTQKQADILQGIVKQAKAKQPLDNALDFACKHAQQIQELLVYVQDTCLNAIKLSAKKVVATPKNNVKKVRITSANVVPPKKTTSHSVETQKPKLKSTADIPSSSSLVMTGSRDTNLYTISLDGMLKTSLICLLSKASKTKSWLWHRRFLRSKDEAPYAFIKCIKNIQVRLNAIVRNVRTDNGTEFVNQTLREFYEKVGMSHQTSSAGTPHQNDIVKRRNQTLVEAARTMLIFSKAPLFLWVEAINTACYTQNRSLISLRYNKTPYELMQDKKLDLSFFHVFGSLCYPTNDNDDLGKLDAKADISIFVGYTPAKKAFRIYNKRTQKIIESIHVTFDELTAMASEQFSTGPGLHSMTPATSSSGLVPNLILQQPWIPPYRDDWDRLFQPMFDEYFNPQTIIVSSVPVATAPRVVDLANSPVSTSIEHDTPSASIPSTQEQEHSPNISQGFEESPKTPNFHDDPLHESPHEDSTSQGSSSNMRKTHTPFNTLVDGLRIIL
nr:hypothetical protein [Tanacetum cinerariifolium]